MLSEVVTCNCVRNPGGTRNRARDLQVQGPAFITPPTSGPPTSGKILHTLDLPFLCLRRAAENCSRCYSRGSLAPPRGPCSPCQCAGMAWSGDTQPHKHRFTVHTTMIPRPLPGGDPRQYSGLKLGPRGGGGGGGRRRDGTREEEKGFSAAASFRQAAAVLLMAARCPGHPLHLPAPASRGDMADTLE